MCRLCVIGLMDVGRKAMSRGGGEGGCLIPLEHEYNPPQPTSDSIYMPTPTPPQYEAVVLLGCCSRVSCSLSTSVAGDPIFIANIFKLLSQSAERNALFF